MTTATRIDGKEIAAELSAQITQETAALLEEHGLVPGLAVVIVGEDPASQVYVRNKKRTAESCGFKSVQHTLAADTSQADVLTLIEELNSDDSIHGILVQLPLPDHMDEQVVTQAISPAKDVDGFHFINIVAEHFDIGFGLILAGNHIKTLFHWVALRHGQSGLA